MKKIIIIFVAALLALQIIQAQGAITYLSNLGQTSTGNIAIGSDSWLAEPFETGTNASGYALNSVQLGMTDASGNPSGFTVMIYSAIIGGGISPGSSLGTLSGSANPATGGIYTYTDDSNIILSSQADYYIVLTAETAVANGAYDWSLTDANSYNPTDRWAAVGGVSQYFYQSSDGLSWSGNLGTYPQFAITATPIPEPSSLILFGLSSLLFIRQRRL